MKHIAFNFTLFLLFVVFAKLEGVIAQDQEINVDFYAPYYIYSEPDFASIKTTATTSDSIVFGCKQYWKNIKAGWVYRGDGYESSNSCTRTGVGAPLEDPIPERPYVPPGPPCARVSISEFPDFNRKYTYTFTAPSGRERTGNYAFFSDRSELGIDQSTLGVDHAVVTEILQGETFEILPTDTLIEAQLFEVFIYNEDVYRTLSTIGQRATVGYLLTNELPYLHQAYPNITDLGSLENANIIDNDPLLAQTSQIDPLSVFDLAMNGIPTIEVTPIEDIPGTIGIVCMPASPDADTIDAGEWNFIINDEVGTVIVEMSVIFPNRVLEPSELLVPSP